MSSDVSLDELLDIPHQRDAERYEIGPKVYGGPVDPPDEPRTVYASVVNARELPVRPIFPAWMRNKTQRRTVISTGLGLAAYTVAYHASRSPKYLAKMLFWSPRGAFRIVWKLLHWTYDLESHGIRQDAATRNNVFEYLSLSNKHDKRVSNRRGHTGFGLAVAAIGIALLLAHTPEWGRWVALAVLVPACARVGRPADKPITDRVSIGERFTKLTAEMVRKALVSLRIPGIKEPGDLEFPPPGIHRDGAGWMARVNLPAGVEVTDVLERRARLSSALRLPVDQVWPTAGAGHAGQLDLWVGMVPASKMPTPRWSLASDKARTSVFAEHEFAVDQRQRPVKTRLFARNFLIGGVPGSGKSYAARALAMIAALDPTCEMKIAEFKGTADFGDLAHLCSEYYCGIDEESLEGGKAIIAWGLAEAERRGQRIRAARERGEAPEGKVTPELAAKPGSGLHPVLILIDEAHELLPDKEVAAAAERLIKRGRALGIIVALATQVPDAKSVPPNITRCTNMRWCLAVGDQITNDMILGTGAYKAGVTSTAYRPGLDAGWGVLKGLAEPTSLKSHFPSPEVAKKMVARATYLRGGAIIGGDVEKVATRDFLDDVRRVFYAGEVFVSWQSIAARLAEQMPEAYADISKDVVSALARDRGIESKDGKDRGSVSTLKGLRHELLLQAISQRQIGAAK